MKRIQRKLSQRVRGVSDGDKEDIALTEGNMHVTTTEEIVHTDIRIEDKKDENDNVSSNKASGKIDEFRDPRQYHTQPAKVPL